MKNYKSLLSIGLLLVFVAGIHCKKALDSDGLPKATQNGSNLFACKINQKNWISEKEYTFPFASFRNDTTVIAGGNTEHPDYIGVFLIHLKGTVQIGKYRLNNSSGNFVEYTAGNCLNAQAPGNKSILASDGEVTITKVDTFGKIISGTFWFDVPTERCEVLKVTHGRFDIFHR